MAEKILNTRIQLKYDTLANWQKVQTTFKPLAGEICIAEVPTVAGSTLQPVMIKIGQYTDESKTDLKTWAQLDWLSAKAADVYGWAKKEKLEFSDIPQEVIESLKGSTDTNDNTTYAFAIVEGKLQVTETPHVLGVAGTPVVTSYDFVTPEELTAILAGYYTKEEADARFQPIGNYKTTQEGKNFTGSTIKTVTGVTQDTNGVIGVTFEEIAFPAPVDITGKKDKQAKVENKITDKAHVLTSLTQNENGEIDYDVKKLTPEDIGAQPAGDYKTKQTAVLDPTAEGTGVEFIATIAQDANGVITATKKTITVADLGLTNAMHFVGAFAEAPASAVNGDVYLNTANKKEYVYSNNGWVELGDEGSHALKTVTITGTDGLTGGGDLSANRTIGLSDATKESLRKADSAVQSVSLVSGSTNGTVKLTVDEVVTDNIAVTGLGSAAFTDATAYATAAQGIKADNAAAAIATYGDIVTHNANEFATAAQGTRIDSLYSTIVSDGENISLPEGHTFVDYATEADRLDGHEADYFAKAAELEATDKEVAKKANDADLAAIAKTGNVNDLVQTEGDVLVFNCGSASTVI